MIAKSFALILGAVIIILGIFFGSNFLSKNSKFLPTTFKESAVPASNEGSQTSVIAENLDTPWGIVFLPDGGMLATERGGRIRLVDNQGKLQAEPVAVIGKAKEIGEGGLLGIAVHPNFSNNSYVYLYYTFDGEAGGTLNRVVRMTYKNERLADEQIIVDNIPGASNHNGGRIKFGPDNYLYITTGDAQNPSQAQDVSTLGGKILRVTDAGDSASGNPFGNLVYSYGHRNPQGLAWDEKGNLWATEHGPSGLQTGNDEVNLIEKGKNYGWPEIKGDQTKEGMITPQKESGTSDTWAPAGAAVWEDELFFGGLRGEALYKYSIKNGDLTALFKGEFGRIREVILGPDNFLYITTSNKDGRGIPKSSDNRIIKINPKNL